MAENRYKRAEKVFPISLGSRGRWFETSYSDHKKAHTATLEDFLADNRKYISALPLLETLTATSNFYT